MSNFSPSKLNLPKLHSWRFHLILSIHQFGAINGFTSEIYELLHKTNVKQPYHNTNKRHINVQMQATVVIRASSNYYGQGAFFDVCIEMDKSEENDYLTDDGLCYAKVLLILRVTSPKLNQKLELALVHCEYLYFLKLIAY
ncbi:hypothetical protein C2G38_2047708 [Gigaspora rosea]|uniref:Uncharacterized protein n=1 Tax=Gigaspora rosea TaxID=44941 RepID=A0A397U507_9GLOM|nr:hypothetical protein C2G38_2047708 [Gigaspora rosea]